MSTHVTSAAITTSPQIKKSTIAGHGVALFWDTLDELCDIGEAWSMAGSVKLALVTWDCASKIDTVTQRYLFKEQAADILAEVTLRNRDRKIKGGIFTGPPVLVLKPKDIEQEIGGLLTYEPTTGRLLMLHRAHAGYFTTGQVIRVVMEGGIYAHVRCC